MYTETVDVTGPLYGPAGYTKEAMTSRPPISLTARAQVREKPRHNPPQRDWQADVQEHFGIARAERAGRLDDPSVDGSERELAGEYRVRHAHERHHQHDPPGRVVDRKPDRLGEPVHWGPRNDKEEQAKPDQEVGDDNR